MKTLRKYGKPPFDTAVIHGGPGAPGEMAPVATQLATMCGVLEPLQTANSLDGQVNELRTVIEEYGTPPMTLIGFSWGAWLSIILASDHPTLVGELVLIGSPPFEEAYAEDIMETRLSRLSEGERVEVFSLMKDMNDSQSTDEAFARFGELITKADSYDPIPYIDQIIQYQLDINLSVWEDASKLRQSGHLLSYVQNVQCPVVAIHGDHDPHPFQGVKDPLTRTLKDFRFILLERCGHRPWVERSATDVFYIDLKEVLDRKIRDRIRM